MFTALLKEATKNVNELRVRHLRQRREKPLVRFNMCRILVIFKTSVQKGKQSDTNMKLYASNPIYT